MCLARWLLLLIACLLCGCASPGELPIVQWSLDGGGEVRMPADVRDRLSARGGTITVRSVAPLPPALRGRDLSLSINVQWCAPQLSVNGEHIDDVARSPFDNERSRGGHLYRIPRRLTDVDSLSLRLDIVDTYAFCSAFFSAPILTDGDYGSGSYRWVVLFNDVAPVAEITAGVLLFVAFLVFALASRRTLFLWAAVAAIGSTAGGLNQLGFWQYFLGWRGDLPSTLLAVVTAYAFLRFTSDYVGAPLRTRAWTAVAWAMVLMLVVTTRRYDLYLMFALVSLSVFLVIGVALAILVRYGWKKRNGRLLTLAVAASCLPLALELMPASGLPDWTAGAHTAALGQTISLLATLVAFARDFRAANTDLETELAATEARGREISALNDELRRQIAERSRDLGDALAGALHAESAARELAPGEVIDGRYIVVRALGRGGMGVVYEVERRTDGKRFALKSMTQHSDSRAAVRFAHEAELVASVHHPNLVSIVDVGFARSGFLYLVMELVDGGSLEAARERFGDAAWAKPLLGHVLAGLAALHTRGVVHRDLKPANVLLDQGIAKIADFGISRRDDAADADPAGDTVVARHLTHTGALIGTPLYMAPELARTGVPARAASDVFSFGVLAYELLTGEYPFASPPVVAALAGIPPAPAKATRSSNPSVDERLAAAVDACLRADPRARPTAHELLTAFAA